jgi:hypothetical protein
MNLDSSGLAEILSLCDKAIGPGLTEAERGAGIGAGASAGLNVGASNADDVHELGGWFINGSAGGGWGPSATGDAFYGQTDDGRRILGGGLSVGAGLGATSFGGATYTWLHDLHRASNPKPCP